MRRSRLGRARDKSHHLPRSRFQQTLAEGSVHRLSRSVTGEVTLIGSRFGPKWNRQGDDSCASGTQPLRGLGHPDDECPRLNRYPSPSGQPGHTPDPRGVRFEGAVNVTG